MKKMIKKVNVIPYDKQVIWKVNDRLNYVDYDVIYIDEETNKERKEVLCTCSFLGGDHIFKYINVKKDILGRKDEFKFLTEIPEKFGVDFKWDYNENTNTWSLFLYDEKFIIDNENDVKILNKIGDNEVYLHDWGCVVCDKETFYDLIKGYVSILNRFIKD